MPKAKSSGVLRLSDARYRLWKSSPPKSFQWPAWNKKSSFQTSWQRAMMAFPLSRNCRCSDIRIILTKLMLSSSLNFYMEIDGNWLFFKFSLSSKIYIHIYTSYVYNCIYMFFWGCTKFTAKTHLTPFFTATPFLLPPTRGWLFLDLHKNDKCGIATS